MNRRPGTRAEGHAIRQTIAEPLQQVLKQQRSSSSSGASPPVESSGAGKTLRFRPLGRQPMAWLVIMDDGNPDHGEVVRIRRPRFVIGRAKGHVVIPLDADMSAQHAEIRCEQQDGKYVWRLIDLKSTNGAFLRVQRAPIADGTELMLGSRRYRFELPSGALADAGDDAEGTRAFQAPAKTLLEQCLPRLSEIAATQGRKASFSLGKNEMIIGRDPQSDVVIPDDAFLNPIHAALNRDASSRWIVEDKRSLNGVWMRISRIALQPGAEFQLGQQRFKFHPYRA